MSKAPKTSTTQNTRRTNPYPPISTSAAMTSPISPPGNRSAGPWSAADDEQLKLARQRGMGWAPIAKEFFPSKSPNACRKRYERLLDKAQSVESWDRTKLDKMARLYCESREQMWRLVATRLGEKWQTVEAKCMEKGIKTLQSTGRRSGKASNTGDNSGNEDHDESGLGHESDRQQQQDPHSASDVDHSRSSRRTYSNASSFAPTPLMPHAQSPSPQHSQYPHQYPQMPVQWPSTLIQQPQAPPPYHSTQKLPSISDVLATTAPPIMSAVTTAT